MRIVGIDPSLTCTGLAVFDTELLTFTHVRKFPDKDKYSNRPERIFHVVDTSIVTIIGNAPDVVVVEDGFSGVNKKVGLELAELRGAFMYQLYAHGYRTEVMKASEARKILLDKGNAKKEEVAKYIDDLFPDITAPLGGFSDKTGKNKTSDIYDAMFTAIAFVENTLCLKKKFALPR